MKYKYYSRDFFYSGLLATMVILLGGCAGKNHAVSKINTAYIEVDSQLPADEEIEDFLQPYKEHITNDLSKILAYNPQDLDKASDKWQNSMTNFYADAILEIAQPIFENRTGKKIDFCLLNFGGIRSTIAKGNITTKTAYDIIPFENSAVVLALKGDVVYEMADYFFKFKAAHPLSGIEIIADKNNFSIKDIKINQQSVDKNATYYVITNDYLAKGGDKMDFFAKAIEEYPLDYKLRNMFIAYFNTIDTLKPSVQPRIFFE